MIYYRQCRLLRGYTYLVTWIPEKYAVLGRALRIKDDDRWADGWIVQDVWQRIPENEISHPPRLIRRHRDATGDSLPRRTGARPT